MMEQELQSDYASRIIAAVDMETIVTFEQRLAAMCALLKAAATVACYTMSVPASRVQPIADELLLQLSQTVEREV